MGGGGGGEGGGDRRGGKAKRWGVGGAKLAMMMRVGAEGWLIINTNGSLEVVGFTPHCSGLAQAERQRTG